MSTFTLYQGDCLDRLKELDDNSIDSIVTDPPYGLAFMGKKWDYDVPSQEIWEECLRVLKPGGHLLSFAGSRTYHRMAVRIEDAGFEIRDQIMWVYGSGFPKSHNIGKALDKNGGNNHLVYEVGEKLKEARESRGISITQADKMFCGGSTNYSWFEGRPKGIRMPNDEIFELIVKEWEELKPYQQKVKSANREVIGKYDGDMGGLGGERLGDGGGDITLPATPIAQQYEGWGTALKPAHEPIVMARKPFKGSVAQNVLEWGTGGINIDGCRIATDETLSIGSGKVGYGSNMDGSNKGEQHIGGRFPANFIIDEEAGKILDNQSGTTKSTKRSAKNNKKTVGTNTYTPNEAIYNDNNTHGDSGGASRFFYCPKSSKKDRNEGMPEPVPQFTARPRREDGTIIYKETHPEECAEAMKGKPRSEKTSLGAAEEIIQQKKIKGRDAGQDERNVPHKARPSARQNIHPTVKPTNLMTYLIRLVTPKDGVVLDPFMGSGSTGKAAIREGFNFVGIEREEEYIQIAEQRIEWEYKKKHPHDWF